MSGDKKSENICDLVSPKRRDVCKSQDEYEFNEVVVIIFHTLQVSKYYFSTLI